MSLIREKKNMGSYQVVYLVVIIAFEFGSLAVQRYDGELRTTDMVASSMLT